MSKFNFCKPELTREVERRVGELFDFCADNDLPLICEVCVYCNDDGTNTDTISASVTSGASGSMTPAMQCYALLAEYDSNVQHQALPLIVRLLSHITDRLTELGN